MGAEKGSVSKMENTDGQRVLPDEGKKRLYYEQKRTLDLFLERGAISRAQYDKSLGDLTRKMGMSGENAPCPGK